MKSYIVSYDLRSVGQNYDCLFKKLKAYGTYCHLQGSVWLIRSSQTASQVRDNLAGCLDKNDKLFVATLTGEAAWVGHSDQASKWIKETV